MVGEEDMMARACLLTMRRDWRHGSRRVRIRLRRTLEIHAHGRMHMGFNPGAWKPSPRLGTSRGDRDATWHFASTCCGSAFRG